MITKTTGIISTVAGNTGNGYGGDNGQASSAALNGPSGVAIDQLTGNVYIADTFNHRIRMITKTTGIISTVAGTGEYGYYGAGGPAILALLNNPTGVTVHPTSGNLFIADSGNYRIRMVSKSTGIITTVAGNGVPGYSGDGGRAVAATLSRTSKIAIDASSGNIYIADSGNNRVRMITKSSGIISTVAGTGVGSYTGDNANATLATLFGPSGVALDTAGNLYIADANNNCIRMVMKRTGIITTVAGNGIPGYTGDGGSAKLAELTRPSDLDLDAAGRLVICDTYNSRVRAVSYTQSVLFVHQVCTLQRINLSTSCIHGYLHSTDDERAVRVTSNPILHFAQHIISYRIISDRTPRPSPE
jgi:sugar lactone lactonase YvrE